MYNTLKSKCFDTSLSDSGRTCRKQGHSCLRKIISWAQHPGRAFFRRASRACEILLRHLRVGWETKSLKVAVSDLRTQWRRCRKDTVSASEPDLHPLCPCKRCGANLDNYTTVIADAAQFYEEVSQDEIVKTLKWVTRRAKQMGACVVTVFPVKRLRGFASARRYTHARNVDVWTHQQIELALLLPLSQSFFSVSSERWRQRRGVPIGGMVSKILCSVVMGASETRWNEDQVRRESLGFGGKNNVADHVDDTISLTRVYCRDSIVIRATMIYPPGIVFEPQPLSGTTSTWLDIDAHLSRRRGLVLTPTRRELTWVNGESSVCQKHVVHPFIALRDLDVTLLRSLIAGRIIRWMQFHLSHNQLREALRHELRLWRRAGYIAIVHELGVLHELPFRHERRRPEESSDLMPSLDGFLLARPEEKRM